MVQTEKLYDVDPYAEDFTAAVISAEKSDAGFRVVLDRTLFFPEGGGQSPDTGTIDGMTVTDVQISGGIITHTVAYKEGISADDEPADILFYPGKTVSGHTDAARRFSNMQNHTGEHILSGLLYSKYGYVNVGFHLSPQIATFDTSGPLTEEQVRELERDANRVVWENVCVTAEYPPEEKLPDMFYRSKGEVEGPVRVVTIEGYDACACCAPHVKRTGEIGLILILKHENYKGGTRFTFACGARALAEVQRNRQTLKALTDMLTTSAEELPASVSGIMAESEARKQRGDSLMRKQAEMSIASQPETEESIWIFDNEYDAAAKRFLINGLVKKTGAFAGIFSGDEGRGYDFIAGSEAADARMVSAKLKEAFGAKGGGSPKMVQGHVNAGRKEIEALLQ